MTYCEGLGAINIARGGTSERDFYAQVARVQAPVVSAPSPWPTATRTVAFAPASKPLPVLKAPLVSKPVFQPAVQPKPIAPIQSVPKPAVSTVGMKPAPSGSVLTSTVDQFSSAFGKSPLPLILVGLGALFLLNRKGR